MMWSDLTRQDWIKYDGDPGGEAELVAAAVRINNIQQLQNLLEKLDQKQAVDVLNNASVDGKPLLHFAAYNGHFEMVKLLVTKGINLLIRNHIGSTALHEAVRAGGFEVAAVLLRRVHSDTTDGTQQNGLLDLAYDSIATLAETGTLINMKDQTGLTPILVLAETSIIDENQFAALVKLLVDNGADVCLTHPSNGQNALYRAVEFNSLTSCKELVGAGALIDHKDFLGDTVIHLAARHGFEEILQFLLQCSRNSVNEKNLKGDTALHCAAMSGSRKCIKVLLNFGGDLSSENNEEETALDTIFSYLPRPKSFMLETLDSKVIPNQCSINDRQFELTMDFRILTPNRERQMSVVVAFMNNINTIDRKTILQHPLLDTYVRFKWTRMKIFFFCFVFIHLIFVVSLSTHVVWLLYPNDPEGIETSRRVLLATATFLMIHVAMQTMLAPKYFLRETETYLSITCVSCAFIMSLSGELHPESSNSYWVRHVASYTVLLSWCQMMFILGRFPTIGFFSLMFFTVFKNVVKVLLTFACLVIGFSLSFCVQFNHFEYEGPWRAFIRTTVMLMGEYEYQTLFSENQGARHRWDDKPSNLAYTSQFIFLLFILLGSVVLVNLMIGMAVNDIQALQEEGNLRHMIKQAEFLLHMDRIMSYCSILRGRTATPSVVTFNPSTINKVKESNFRRLGLSIPSHVIEGLVKIALKNQKKNGENTGSRRVIPNSSRIGRNLET